MKSRTIPPLWSWVLLAAILVAATGIGAQENATHAARLIEVLQARPGSVMADIGAGPEALLTIPIARHVGPSGKVYATELGDLVGKLRTTVQRAGLRNVEVVEGHPSRTNLSDDCCDGIFLRSVYHHFADPPAMNASLRQSLKPGGRLAVIEFAPIGPEAATPADRAGDQTHGVGADAIVRELQQAGFQLVSSEQSANREVLVVVQKPR